MTSNADGELYRAAVGDRKAHYYVPLFLRFDEGDGRASWNWPAFFVTFFWLLYRRMYGIAALYFVAFPLALVFIAIVVGAVLGEAAGGFVYLAAAVAVPWIVMPMFANAMITLTPGRSLPSSVRPRLPRKRSCNGSSAGPPDRSQAS